MNGGDEYITDHNNNQEINTLSTAATTGNTYESSGESSQDDDHHDETSSPLSSPTGNNPPASPVRDLSSMVRRKGEAKQPQTPQEDPAQKKAKDENGGDETNKDNSNNLKNISTKHRLLCTLSAHTGSLVLAVRFSNHGTYLASAGDDAVVCVYAKQSTSNTGAMSIDSMLSQ